MPGIETSTAWSCCMIASWSSAVGREPTIAIATFGPPPVTVSSSPKNPSSSAVRNPYSACRSSRNTWWVNSFNRLPGAGEASTDGDANTRYPTPPTSTIRPSNATAATMPSSEAITRASPRSALAPDGALGRLLARDRLAHGALIAVARTRVRRHRIHRRPIEHGGPALLGARPLGVGGPDGDRERVGGVVRPRRLLEP